MIKFRKDDVEFVAGPGLDTLDPAVMDRVGNMLQALKDADDRADKLEKDCNDRSDDDRSPAGHAKEAQNLEEAAREAAKSGDEKLAAAFRAKAEFHHEEISRKDKDVRSPISGPGGGHQPTPPKKPGKSPISDSLTVR
jgi:Skp family chaperone for outer membrane proteins